MALFQRDEGGLFKTIWGGKRGEARQEVHTYVSEMINPSVLTNVRKADQIRPPPSVGVMAKRHPKGFEQFYLPSTIEPDVPIPWYSHPLTAKILFYLVVCALILAGWLASSDPMMHAKLQTHHATLQRLAGIERKGPLLEDSHRPFEWIRMEEYHIPQYSAPEANELAIGDLKEVVVTPEYPSAEYRAAARLLQLELKNRSATGEVQLLMVGERFEAWRGSEMGAECKVESDCFQVGKMVREQAEAEGLRGVNWRGLPEDRSMFWALRDDTAGRLLWRILEADVMPYLEPQVTVLHIGGNDIPSALSAKEIAAAVRSVVREIQKLAPTTYVLLASLLPRADDVYARDLKEAKGGVFKKPSDPRKGRLAIPFQDSKYYDKILEVNRWLMRIAAVAPAPGTGQPGISYMDCTSHFLVPGASAATPTDIPYKLMPDMQHLSLEGHYVWRACMKETIDYLDKSLRMVPSHHKFKRLNKFVGKKNPYGHRL